MRKEDIKRIVEEIYNARDRDKVKQIIKVFEEEISELREQKWHMRNYAEELEQVITDNLGSLDDYLEVG